MRSLSCDFCSTQNPKYWYPATDFQAWQVNGVTGSSRGEWAACEPCYALIEADDRKALAERSMKALVKDEPDAEKWAGPKIEDIHNKFFENRLGPARLIERAEA